MKLEEKQFAEKCLRHMFIGSQLDGIKFGLSPATTFIYFMHYSHRSPDRLWIHIKSMLDVFSSDHENFSTSEQEMGELTEEGQYEVLFELRREEVIEVRLGDLSPHLSFTFKSGKVLFINGYHTQYECWQAGDGHGQGYTGDEWLVVATPQNGITTWSPDQ